MIVKRLTESGVLGINRRNADFTWRYNPRRLYPLVDDKLATKTLAQRAGIAVPELYGVVEAPHQVRGLPALLEPYQDFVIKPVRGSGGMGIIVVTGKAKKMDRNADGTLIGHEELRHHVLNVLGGMYSLAGQPDKAMIEYRVNFDPIFETVSYLGVPDIRIVVFQGVPVMSMVRLPTRLSGGRGNLHQGAVGAGIDLGTGETIGAVWREQTVTEHPDTGNRVIGIRIPNWRDLLALASRCHELTGLGYLGVDVVLDRQKGPLILELNARPGLSIQIANLAGLLPRLRLVEEHLHRLQSLEERVAFARNRFAAAKGACHDTL